MRKLATLLLFSAVGLLALNLEPGSTPTARAVAPPARGAAVAPPARDPAVASATGRSPAAPSARHPAAAAGQRAVKADTTVRVAFVRDGRLVRVERIVPPGVAPEQAALRELLEGPTRAERADGLRTSLRPGARLRSLRARDDTWLASFSRSLLSAGTAQTVRTRLLQIEATLAPLGPERFLAIATEGRFVTLLRLGSRPASPALTTGEQGYRYSVRGIQLRLLGLGYLDRSEVTGTLDDETSQSLLAFQAWEGIDRTGTVTGRTQLALMRAERPVPATHEPGRHIEIHRDLGVLLMLDGNRVVRVVHTSTGSFGRTPAGSFHVYRKELYSWSVPFKVWMPFASYFVGGIAMHQYSYVPAYPASHGCVRLPAGDAKRVYAFVRLGTPVAVY